MTIGKLVRQFHEAFGLPVLKKPQFPSDERRSLRWDLDAEEYEEACEANYANDLPAFVEETADRIIVAIGQMWEHGVDIEKVVAEKMKANMSKIGSDGKPIYRKDGKVLKGPNYRPADTIGVLRRMGYKG